MAKRKTTRRVSSKLAKIVKAIPGYDPIATAGKCRFDEEAATDALEFFPAHLKHVKGELAGQPLRLELWEQSIIANLFGWKRPDGTRRYREAFIYLPRKNGKTTLVAGVVCYVMFCDGEPGAEIYSAAADREQAMLVFAQAEGMVVQSSEMSALCTIYKAAKSIVYGTSSYKAISAEANTKHGYNTHLAVIDELHAQPNRDLVDVLATSTGARRQPMIIHVTTADFDRDSICNEKLDYAEKVRDGVMEDESFFPVIYAASLDDDWCDPKVWARVNPNLDVSLSREYLERECKRAQENPSYENTFKRLHLNVRTEQAVRWIQLAAWDACDRTITEEELVGHLCYSGLDLASTGDIAAHVMAFDLDDGFVALLPRFWIPEDNARKRERQDRVPYTQWAREGYIKMTPGNVIDYAVIQADVEADWEKFSIKEMAFDRWNVEYLRQRVIAKGVPDDALIAFGQGFHDMSAPSKEFEKLIMAEKLIHCANPVMRWMASNVAVETDAAGNIKPSKKASTEKIDGIVATVMALGRLMLKTQVKQSVYVRRGPRGL